MTITDDQIRALRKEATGNGIKRALGHLLRCRKALREIKGIAWGRHLQCQDGTEPDTDDIVQECSLALDDWSAP